MEITPDMDHKEFAIWIARKLAIAEACQSKAGRDSVRQELADGMVANASRIAEALMKLPR